MDGWTDRYRLILSCIAIWVNNRWGLNLGRVIYKMNRSMKETINPRDISIVVQGPIAGLPGDEPQKRYTNLCLESIRRTLPGATIILAT